MDENAIAPSPLRRAIEPDLEKRLPAIRQRLLEVYGFIFPEDFFLFWQFVDNLPQHLKQNNEYTSTLDICLGEAFAIFQTNIDLQTYNPLDDSRYYNDPPEFFTIFSGDCDGLHWGYYIDDPDRDPQSVCVVSYYARDAYELSINGYNIFEAMREQLESLHRSDLDNLNYYPEDEVYVQNRLERLAELRHFLQEYCTAERTEIGDDYLNKYRVRRTTIAPTREGMGIILPEHLYRPLPGYDFFNDYSRGWNYQPTREEVNSMTNKAYELLRQGYPGAALKLGKDLWDYSLYVRISYELMDAAYDALDRQILRRVLYYRKSKTLTSLKAYQDALIEANDPALLSSLCLQGERLGFIGAEIAQFSGLETLELNFNDLEELPIELAQLSHLKELRLDYNIFTHFPSVLCQMPQLEQLYITGNYLTEIPDAIAGMRSLRELYLDDNKLQNFPTAVFSLSNLEILFLRKMSIRHLPDDIKRLACLRELRLESDRPLTYIPDDLSCLTQLEVLQFIHTNRDRNYEKIIQFPQELCYLPRLKNLAIDANEEITLPQQIQNLQSLEHLELSCYLMEDFPEVICELINLKTLRLRGKIRSIPDAIRKLKYLEELDLYGNRIESLGTGLTELQSLRIINLSANNLQARQHDELKRLFPNAELSL